MCVLQTCITLHQERCVLSSIKSEEYPEKAEFPPESCSKSGSNHAKTTNFGKFRVAGEINRGSLNEILTMHMGPDFVLVNVSVDFVDPILATEVEVTVARLDGAIKLAYPQVQRIFVELETWRAKDSGQG